MSIWFKDYSEISLKDASTGIDKTLGIEYLELGVNFLTAKMPVNDHTKQPLGLLHGGASCVLAESVASFAAFLCINPEKKNVVGLNLNANHLKSVKDGFVFAKASIPANSAKPTTKIRRVSLTKAKNVFAIPGITNFKA